jgi:dUTP pyrophosphatase
LVRRLELRLRRGRRCRMSALALKFRVGPNGVLPSRAYPDDAGLDLYVSEDVIVPVDGYADVPTDVAVQLPPHTWGLIVGRSSTIRDRRLLVTHAVIDTGWRGELFSAVQNVGRTSCRLVKGERIAQLVLCGNMTEQYEPVVVDQLAPHQHGRNVNGFGSSGR